MRKVISLFLIVFSFFLFTNVKAKEDIISIEDISIEKKSEGVVVNQDPVLKNNNLKSDLLFNDIGDYITYKLVLKNNGNKDYIIQQISDNNENDQVKYSYQFDEKEIKKGKEKEVYLTITYKNEIPGDATFDENMAYHFDNSATIIIDLVEPSEEIIVNPQTFTNSVFFIIIIMVSVTIYNHLVKTKKINKLFLILLILTSFYTVSAKDENIQVKLTLNDKYAVHISFLENAWVDRLSGTYTKIAVTKDMDIPESAVDVSEKQDGSIKAWIDNDTVYIGSKYIVYTPIDSNNLFSRNTNVNEIKFGENSISSRFSTNLNSMFSGLLQLTELDSSWIDTSNATTLTDMFLNCSNIQSLNLDDWDLSKTSAGSLGLLIAGTTSLKYLSCKNWVLPETFNNGFFRSLGGSGSPIEEIDVTGWDLTRTKSLEGMFDNGHTLREIKGLDTWDTSTIENMAYIFNNSNKLTSLYLNNWNTSNVTNMAGMFSGCSSLTTLDLSSFDTSNVTSMYRMFCNCNSLTSLDLSNFDTSSVISISELFSGCFNLESIDLSALDFSNVQSYSLMFDRMYNLKELILPKKLPTVNSIIILPNIYEDANHNRYEEFNNTIPPKTKLTISEYLAVFTNGQNFNGKVKRLAGDEGGYTYYQDSNIISFKRSYTKPNISQMSEDNIVSDNHKNAVIYAWFDNGTIYYYSDVEQLYFYSNSSNMFSYMKNLQEIEFDTVSSSKVTNMSQMFYYAGDTSPNVNIDLSGWDTSKVTNMMNIFIRLGYSANSFNLNLSGWNTSNVTNMGLAFNNTGYNATNFSITIPKTNGNGINNTPDVLYGKTTSVYAWSPSSSKQFTLASS